MNNELYGSMPGYGDKIVCDKCGRMFCDCENKELKAEIASLQSENAELRKAQEWVGVLEGLPEISTPVCLLLQHGETGITWETFGYLDDQGWMIYSQSVLDVLPDTNYHIRNYDVVLWQPLPALPE